MITTNPKHIRLISIILITIFLLIGCIHGLTTLFKSQSVHDFHIQMDSILANASSKELELREEMNTSIRTAIQDTIPENMQIVADYTYCYHNGLFMGEYHYLLEDESGSQTTHSILLRDELAIVCEAYPLGYVEEFPAITFDMGFLSIDWSIPSNTQMYLSSHSDYFSRLYDQVFHQEMEA